MVEGTFKQKNRIAIDMKPRLLIIPAIFSLTILLSACDKTTSKADPGEKQACPELEKIFSEMDAFEGSITSGPWKEAAPKLDSLIQDIDHNVHTSVDSCSFLNHQQYPEKVRFVFVSDLTAKIINDTLAEGISRLVKLHNVFSDDQEVTEFIGEDLNHIAQSNPIAYLDYYNEQDSTTKVRVEDITRWSSHPGKAIFIFEQLPKSEALVEYISSLHPVEGTDSLP